MNEEIRKRIAGVRRNKVIPQSNRENPRMQISRTQVHAGLSKATQIAMEISVGALQQSMKMILQAIRRTPMTIKLALRMVLQMKKNRLNQAALEERLRNPMDVILTPNLKKAHGWTPHQTLMTAHQIVIWT